MDWLDVLRSRVLAQEEDCSKVWKTCAGLDDRVTMLEHEGISGNDVLLSVQCKSVKSLEDVAARLSNLEASFQELPSAQALHSCLERIHTHESQPEKPTRELPPEVAISFSMSEQFARLETRFLSLEAERNDRVKEYERFRSSMMDKFTEVTSETNALKRRLDGLDSGWLSCLTEITSKTDALNSRLDDLDMHPGKQVLFGNGGVSIASDFNDQFKHLEGRLWNLEKENSQRANHPLAEGVVASQIQAFEIRCSQMDKAKVGLDEFVRLRTFVTEKCNEIVLKTDSLPSPQEIHLALHHLEEHKQILQGISDASGSKMNVRQVFEARCNQVAMGGLDEYERLRSSVSEMMSKTDAFNRRLDDNRSQVAKQESDLKALVGDVDELRKKDRHVLTEMSKIAFSETLQTKSEELMSIIRFNDERQRKDREIMAETLRRSIKEQCTCFRESITQYKVGVDEYEQFKSVVMGKHIDIESKTDSLTRRFDEHLGGGGIASWLDTVAERTEKSIQERCSELRMLISKKEELRKNDMVLLTETVSKKCMETISSRSAELTSLTEGCTNSIRQSCNALKDQILKQETEIKELHKKDGDLLAELSRVTSSEIVHAKYHELLSVVRSNDECQKKEREVMAESLRRAIKEESSRLQESKADKHEQDDIVQRHLVSVAATHELKLQISKHEGDFKALLSDVSEIRKKDRDGLSDVSKVFFTEAINTNYQDLMSQIRSADESLRRVINEQCSHLREAKADKHDQDSIAHRHMADVSAIELRISEMWSTLDEAVTRKIHDVVMYKCGEIESKTNALSKHLDDKLRERCYQTSYESLSTTLRHTSGGLTVSGMTIPPESVWSSRKPDMQSLWSAVQVVERRGNIQVNCSTGYITLLRQLEYQLTTTKDQPAAVATFVENFRDPAVAEAVCKDLAEVSGIFRCPMTIEGHTKGGESEFWQTTADRRAHAVAEAMIRFGANPSLLCARGLPGRIGKNEARTEVYIDMHNIGDESCPGARVDAAGGRMLGNDLSRSGICSRPQLDSSGWPASPRAPQTPNLNPNKSRGQVHNFALTR